MVHRALSSVQIFIGYVSTKLRFCSHGSLTINSFPSVEENVPVFKFLRRSTCVFLYLFVCICGRDEVKSRVKAACLPESHLLA